MAKHQKPIVGVQRKIKTRTWKNVPQQGEISTGSTNKLLPIFGTVGAFIGLTGLYFAGKQFAKNKKNKAKLNLHKKATKGMLAGRGLSSLSSSGSTLHRPGFMHKRGVGSSMMGGHHLMPEFLHKKDRGMGMPSLSTSTSSSSLGFPGLLKRKKSSGMMGANIIGRQQPTMMKRRSLTNLAKERLYKLQHRAQEAGWTGQHVMGEQLPQGAIAPHGTFGHICDVACQKLHIQPSKFYKIKSNLIRPSQFIHPSQYPQEEVIEEVIEEQPSFKNKFLNKFKGNLMHPSQFIHPSQYPQEQFTEEVFEEQPSFKNRFLNKLPIRSQKHYY